MSEYKLWQRYGIEMEYMIVDRDSLNVLPRADIPSEKTRRANNFPTWNTAPSGFRTNS